jgi:hypothetical protein
VTIDLTQKRPAEIVRQTSVPPPVTRCVRDLVAPTRRALRADLERRSRAGEIEKAWNMRLITEGRLAGRFAVRVVLVPPRAVTPRWARVCIAVGAVLAGAAALLASLAWLLASLTGPALLTFGVVVLGMFCAWLRAKYGRRTSVVVTTTTTVQMR